MEPKKYLGDNFSRVTQIFRVSHYNVACCYSSINQARPAPAAGRAGAQCAGACAGAPCAACQRSRRAAAARGRAPRPPAALAALGDFFLNAERA